MLLEEESRCILNKLKHFYMLIVFIKGEYRFARTVTSATIKYSTYIHAFTKILNLINTL